MVSQILQTRVLSRRPSPLSALASSSFLYLDLGRLVGECRGMELEKRSPFVTHELKQLERFPVKICLRRYAHHRHTLYRHVCVSMCTRTHSPYYIYLSGTSSEQSRSLRHFESMTRFYPRRQIGQVSFMHFRYICGFWGELSTTFEKICLVRAPSGRDNFPRWHCGCFCFACLFIFTTQYHTLFFPNLFLPGRMDLPALGLPPAPPPPTLSPTV